MPSTRFLLTAALPLLLAAVGQAEVCTQNGCCNGMIIANNICCEGDPNVGTNSEQSSCTAGTSTTLSGGPMTSGPAVSLASPAASQSSSDIIGGGITGNGAGGEVVNCDGSVCSTSYYGPGQSIGASTSMAAASSADSGSGSSSASATSSGASAQSSGSSHNGAMATVMPAAYLGLGVVAAAYGAM